MSILCFVMSVLLNAGAIADHNFKGTALMAAVKGKHLETVFFSQIEQIISLCIINVLAY